jgi:hypothetical protein
MDRTEERREAPRTDTLGETNRLDAGVAFGQPQLLDEGAELRAVDLVADGEQRGRRVHHVELGVETGLNLLAGGLGVGQELGTVAARRGGGHVPACGGEEHARQGQDRVRHPRTKGQAAG